MSSVIVNEIKVSEPPPKGLPAGGLGCPTTT